jgi:hypothetical protein
LERVDDYDWKLMVGGRERMKVADGDRMMVADGERLIGECGRG